MEQFKNRSAKIFIVDDDRISLRLLEKNLVKLGYDCVLIQDSRQTLELAKKCLPDLFLLDFLMPELNGLELCHQLKSEKLFHNIPIIFITAVEDTGQKLEAFNAGAVDYITKPLNMKEAYMRIKTHLELFWARKEIEEYAANMERLAEEKNRQLMHADRLATIGVFCADAAREIDYSASFMSENISALETSWNRETKKIVRDFDENRTNFGGIANEITRLLSSMKTGIDKIKEIVDRLRGFSREEDIKKSSFRIVSCIESALSISNSMLKKDVRIENRIKDHDMMIYGYFRQIEQVFINLIVNSYDALSGVNDASLCIETSRDNNIARIAFSNNGPLIPSDVLEKIWDPFFTTKDPGHGTGLGLAIVRSITTSHRGEIDVVNRAEGGIRFNISLPLCN